MNQISRLAVAVLLLISVLTLPVMADTSELFSEKPVKHFTFLDNDFDSGSHDIPIASTNFSLVDDPDGDKSHGKVGWLDGSDGQLMVSVANKNKIWVSFDFKSKSSGTSLAFTIRGQNSSGATALSPFFLQIKSGKINGKNMNLGEWYTANLIFDYTNSKKYITVVDSSGQTIIEDNGSTLSLGSIAKNRQSHVRFNTGGQFYLDNFVIEEDVFWPQLDSVTNSSGETAPQYDTNTVYVHMTEDMDIITKENLSLIRNIDGSTVPIDSVEVTGGDIAITCGKKLQSSSEYTLKISGDTKIKYRSLPLGEEITKVFKTTSRDFDMTDVHITSDGNKIIASASFENNTSSAKSPVVMVSAYDSEDRITAIKFAPVTVASDGGTATSSPVEITVADGGYIKLISIIDFDNMAPINNNIYTYSLR